MKEDITKWIWQHKDYPNFKYNKLELTDLLTLITPSWVRFNMKKASEFTPMFARFARNVFGVIESDDKKAAEMGIEALENFYKVIGMPKNMREAGVEEDKLEYLSAQATEFGDIGTMTSITKNEALEIYKMAW